MGEVTSNLADSCAHTVLKGKMSLLELQIFSCVHPTEMEWSRCIYGSAKLDVTLFRRKEQESSSMLKIVLSQAHAPRSLFWPSEWPEE